MGFPVGGALRRIIYDKLDYRSDDFGQRDPRHGDSNLFEWIRRQHRDRANNYLTACKRIRAGILTSASIDDYLDVHREDTEMVECGKLAIAQTILEAEKSSLLAFDTSNIHNTLDFARLENTWYLGFFRLLHQNLTKANRHDIFGNTSIISFNYDRSIQHFLVHALAAHYQIPRDEAYELARRLPIYQPYGSVGELGSAPNQVAFGLADIRNVDQISKNIRTYTEQITDEASLSKIRTAVKDASVIVFLGNAFHANNMMLITPDESIAQRKRVFYTRLGVSDADLAVVNKMLRRLSSDAQKRATSPSTDYYYTDTCHKLFEEFRLSLRA